MQIQEHACGTSPQYMWKTWRAWVSISTRTQWKHVSRGQIHTFEGRRCVNQEGGRCMQFRKFLVNRGPKSEPSLCRIQTRYRLNCKFLWRLGQVGRTGNRGPYRQHEGWHNSQASPLKGLKLVPICEIQISIIASLKADSKMLSV